MKTYASLPGLNPIENVWASVKQYRFNVHKPRRKYELVGGIKAFWASLTAVQFGRYIDHIHRSSDSYIVLIKGDTSRFWYVCQWTLSVKLWFGLVWFDVYFKKYHKFTGCVFVDLCETELDIFNVISCFAYCNRLYDTVRIEYVDKWIFKFQLCFSSSEK